MATWLKVPFISKLLNPPWHLKANPVSLLGSQNLSPRKLLLGVKRDIKHWGRIKETQSRNQGLTWSHEELSEEEAVLSHDVSFLWHPPLGQTFLV